VSCSHPREFDSWLAAISEMASNLLVLHGCTVCFVYRKKEEKEKADNLIKKEKSKKGIKNATVKERGMKYRGDVLTFEPTFK
jgi:hypothetical protein